MTSDNRRPLPDPPPPTPGVPLPPSEDDLPCAAFVEMVTDYLDGAIPADLRTRLDHHLAFCDGCRSVLAQIERVVHLTGRLTEDDVEALPDHQRDQLMDAFRNARSGR
jgi:predicted anti-sigma-YlaC factor YlaD